MRLPARLPTFAMPSVERKTGGLGQKVFRVSGEVGGINRHITPHICRRTAATWAMQQGADIWKAADYLGMSSELLEKCMATITPISKVTLPLECRDKTGTGTP